MSKILIVEDSKSMRQMASFTLKSAGYDVVEANDGNEGLAKAKSETFDAILTDMNMPNMNGIEMSIAIRAIAQYKATPIIMLTTESSADEKVKGKQAGVTGWIVKPFQPNRLLEAFKRIL